MGKIKRSRQKRHLEAVKPTKEENKNDALITNESTLPAIFPTAGLFGANGATCSEITDARPVEKLQVNKKHKRRERHERFLQKLHAGRLVEERNKKAKQRAKTAVVGDMEPLLSALPTIHIPDLSITNSAGKSDGNEKPTAKKTKMSKKFRKALQASEIAHFQQVLKHPAFKANPLAAISEHIKNAVQKEHEDGT